MQTCVWILFDKEKEEKCVQKIIPIVFDENK